MCNYENAENLQARAMQGIGGVPRRNDVVSELEYRMKEASVQMSRAERGYEFLKAHPEFAKFLELQREGCF